MSLTKDRTGKNKTLKKLIDLINFNTTDSPHDIKYKFFFTET